MRRSGDHGEKWLDTGSMPGASWDTDHWKNSDTIYLKGKSVGEQAQTQ